MRQSCHTYENELHDTMIKKEWML